MKAAQWVCKGGGGGPTWNQHAHQNLSSTAMHSSSHCHAFLDRNLHLVPLVSIPLLMASAGWLSSTSGPWMSECEVKESHSTDRWELLHYTSAGQEHEAAPLRWVLEPAAAILAGRFSGGTSSRLLFHTPTFFTTKIVLMGGWRRRGGEEAGIWNQFIWIPVWWITCICSTCFTTNKTQCFAYITFWAKYLYKYILKC